MNPVKGLGCNNIYINVGIKDQGNNKHVLGKFGVTHLETNHKE